jgi:Ran GTPase-activating protein (RanGAP) involved in mRNA processing and transport
VLANVLKEHPTLKSLCGNRGDETELDMSGKSMCAEDAILLAAEIIGNGAMTSLNISDNYIGSGAHGTTVGSQALSSALQGNSTLKELNVSSNYFRADDAKILADGIGGNVALTKLDISNNNIGQGEPLQLISEVCNTKGIELDS